MPTWEAVRSLPEQYFRVPARCRAAAFLAPCNGAPFTDARLSAPLTVALLFSAVYDGNIWRFWSSPAPHTMTEPPASWRPGFWQSALRMHNARWQVGKAFQNDDSVVVAKIDATANDIPNANKFKVQSQPSNAEAGGSQ